MYSHTLRNGQIVQATLTNPYPMNALFARFQIWAEQYGLSNAESLACLVCDNEAKIEANFKTNQECQILATSGFQKLEGIVIPDLTDFSR